MQSVKVPWAMYYSKEKFEMTFPDTWKIEVSFDKVVRFLLGFSTEYSVLNLQVD